MANIEGLVNKIKACCLDLDDLLVEAESIDSYGESIHMFLLGYTGDEIREAVRIVRAENENEKEVTSMSVEEQKERAKNMNELVEHLTSLISSDDKRFSFEFAVGGTMEVYDKEKEIGYVLHIAPIEYDEAGNAINL